MIITYSLEKKYILCSFSSNRRICEGLPVKLKTETFKITIQKANMSSTKWILHYNGTLEVFDKLTELAQFIPTESKRKTRIPPSDNDKSPLLLICLPKNVQSKKTEKELSEAELQRKGGKIFYLSKDLQWYRSK